MFDIVLFSTPLAMGLNICEMAIRIVIELPMDGGTHTVMMYRAGHW